MLRSFPMQEEKIETFLTQIKSLDTLALSIIEDLKLSKLQNDMLSSEKDKLQEELRLARAEIVRLQEVQENQTPQEESVKPKPKKTKSKAVEPDAPTLF